MLTELRRRLVVALVVAAAFPARAVAAALLAVPGVQGEIYQGLAKIGRSWSNVWSNACEIKHKLVVMFHECD